MNAPQLVVVEFDGWIAKQLSELATEHRWLVREERTVDNALSLIRVHQPLVLIVQVEPTDDKPAAMALIADAHRLFPEVPVVAVGDAKLNDADRAAWTAALFDLGARYALFPPITKPVLEDVISGLMATAIRRITGAEPSAPAEAEEPTLPKPKPRKRRAPKDKVIDLADEEFDS
ncbi:MAG: hypothetical protein L0241_26320 [Planctomycetia bacterium]|nr:hypothetical protein [Planctomycetia bacterium]